MIAVVPAAGIGQRMNADRPKQYLELNGKTVLELSIAALMREPRIERVYVAIQAGDTYFPQLPLSRDPRIVRTPGGATRADSVRQALEVAQQAWPSDTLVAVHDAARPGLAMKDLGELLDAASENPAQGALLAIPVTDTVKRGDAHGYAKETLNREELWLAATPQVFQLQPLLHALQAAELSEHRITDEASAMELTGVTPRLVAAGQSIRKVTQPEDLILVATLMEQQETGRAV